MPYTACRLDSELTKKKKTKTSGKGGRKNQGKYLFSSFCLLHVTLNINHELFLALKWRIF